MKPQTFPSDPLKLLELLAERGIQVFLEGDTLKATPKDKLTPDVIELVRPHAQELKQMLKTRGPGKLPVPPLPWELETLVRAAFAGTLPSGSIKLPNGGTVSDLEGYTLQEAASYLIGDQAHALQNLWAVHSTWQKLRGVN